MVVQKNIYGAMWASQTMKSQLSRDISLSLDHDIYSLETWISHTILTCQLFIKATGCSEVFEGHANFNIIRSMY